MDKSADKYRNGNWLFYACLWAYFICGSLGDSMLSQNPVIARLIRVITIACVPLFLARFLLLERFRLESMASFSLFAIVAAYIYLVTKSRLPLFTVLTLYGAEKVDSRTVGWTYVLSTGIVLTLSTVLSRIGVIEDRIFITGYGAITRHSFGMNYVTIWAAYVFFVYATILYLRNRPIDWKVWLASVILAIVMFRYCRARLECIMLIALPLMLSFTDILSHSRVFKWFSILCFPLAGTVVFVVQHLYMKDASRFAVLDNILSLRLREAAKVLSFYSFKPFGQAIRMQGYGTVNYDASFGYFFIDSFYLNYALRYGLVIMLLLTVTSVTMFYFLYRAGHIKVLIFLLVTCIHGIIISSILTPYVNPLFIMAFADYSSRRHADLFARADDNAPRLPVTYDHTWPDDYAEGAYQ